MYQCTASGAGCGPRPGREGARPSNPVAPARLSAASAEILLLHRLRPHNIYNKYSISHGMWRHLLTGPTAMRLTAYTDYTLRTLMHLGRNRDTLVTIQDIADLHGISKNHLMKVVHQLGLSGMVETVRGRNGGLRLNREPADINIGEVVRNTETDFFMAECFAPGESHCGYASDCTLKGVLHAATAAYLKVLDGVTLEDLIGKSSCHAGTDGARKPIRIHQAKPEVLR